MPLLDLSSSYIVSHLNSTFNPHFKYHLNFLSFENLKHYIPRFHESSTRVYSHKTMFIIRGRVNNMHRSHFERDQPLSRRGPIYVSRRRMQLSPVKGRAVATNVSGWSGRYTHSRPFGLTGFEARLKRSETGHRARRPAIGIIMRRETP